MIGALIGLFSSTITAGIKKSNAKIEDIQTQLAQKKLEELTGLGLAPGVVSSPEIVGTKQDSNLLLIGAALLAALLIFKR